MSAVPETRATGIAGDAHGWLALGTAGMGYQNKGAAVPMIETCRAEEEV